MYTHILMGIKDFYKILKSHGYTGKWKKISSLFGKKIAVDASMQIVLAKTKKNNLGLEFHFTRLLDFFVENEIFAIFVFDDRKHPCAIKAGEHIKRKKTRARSKQLLRTTVNEFNDLLHKGKSYKLLVNEFISTDSNIVNTILSYTCDNKRYFYLRDNIKKRKKSLSGVSWSIDDICLIKNLIDKYNFVSVDTPYHEAENLCARLSELNIVDYVLSKDSDVFLMGGKKMIFLLIIESNNFKCFKIDDILKSLDLNMKQFTNLCFILGNDFIDRIRGNGPVKSYKLIKNDKFNGDEIVSSLYEKKLIDSVKKEISYHFKKEITYIKKKYIEYSKL